MPAKFWEITAWSDAKSERRSLLSVFEYTSKTVNLACQLRRSAQDRRCESTQESRERDKLSLALSGSSAGSRNPGNCKGEGCGDMTR